MYSCTDEAGQLRQNTCSLVTHTWGSIVFSMWTNSGFSTVYMVTMSLAICNATASVIAFHWAPFLSYGIKWENDSANVDCFLASVCELTRPYASRCKQHSSHSAACLCLRCWNKLVVLLPLVVTAFEQTLQRAVVYSRSDTANPNQFHTTDETVPVLGTSSSFFVAMLQSVSWGRAVEEVNEKTDINFFKSSETTNSK